MRYPIFLLLTLLIISYVSAQNNNSFYIISSSKVYDMPSTKGKAIGVYARGGVATELKKFNNGWSEILVENGDKAYIPSRFLAASLNARDNYEPDPDDFVLPGEADAEYGSPHLFITAASVKARALFAKNKPVAKIYRTNEPVPVSYLPYDSNRLVKIGGGVFAGDRSAWLFTQRRFLGRKLNFEKTVSEYNTLPKTDTAKRKMLAERIYEMSWRDNKSNNLQGIRLFRNHQKETGNNQLYQQLAFDEFLLKATQEAEQQKSTAFDESPIRFTISGKMLPAHFTEKDILDIPLSRKIITNGTGYPECGVEVTKEYAFDHFKVYHSQTETLTYFPQIRFHQKEIAITIAGFVIDGDTTEETFLKKLGKFVTYDWLDKPHVYYISGDGDALALTFKNGKAVLYEYWFYC
ncbi:SH3 domain-containing protein [Niabella yanshanensis]|uniref:SH3 domain-containing protein n=1 Tax=Niabella yanshanensis TaxID=577386 RepID=A0ABZ0WCU7_9BACT|nr:SH3 domain-containing protein [Niabella yanshanensis]WQD39842.1 SH3 domain-containing protein [Niabella yanshanensis]